jgi:hypothetical protein
MPGLAFQDEVEALWPRPLAVASRHYQIERLSEHAAPRWKHRRPRGIAARGLHWSRTCR